MTPSQSLKRIPVKRNEKSKAFANIVDMEKIYKGFEAPVMRETKKKLSKSPQDCALREAKSPNKDMEEFDVPATTIKYIS